MGQVPVAAYEAPLIPLRDDVFFPEHMGVLAIGRHATVAAVREAGEDGRVVVAAQRDPDLDEPGLGGVYPIACAARISVIKALPKPPGAYAVALVGLHRVRILFPIAGQVRVEPLGEPIDADPPLDAYRVDLLRELARAILRDRGLSRGDATRVVSAVAGPGRLVDLIAGSLPLSVPDKQALLEDLDVERRVRRILKR